MQVSLLTPTLQLIDSSAEQNAEQNPHKRATLGLLFVKFCGMRKIGTGTQAPWNRT